MRRSTLLLLGCGAAAIASMFDGQPVHVLFMFFVGLVGVIVAGGLIYLTARASD